MQHTEESASARDRRVRNRTIWLTVVLVAMGVVGGLLWARWKSQRERQRTGVSGWAVSERQVAPP